MGDIANEPSMEEILSSIKRIIAEEGEGAVTARTRTAARKTKALPDPEPEEEVLELTETVIEPDPVAKAPEIPAETPVRASALVSENAALASREKLASLSALIVKPEAGDNTLEGLVREMLRPMLKEWLDSNLPELVERVVAKEVARIIDRGL
ncbi:DUF2497 domain-containing protein [Sphingomonas sp. LaA6.9]|uniref:DUF2497 domain-containing protein n=1 Tax=Sphingomonas sp. LaA6.9 TaxID=2919914 RepID=UPI001F503AFC|nr:DUF2497 domain-containing protein [Sphingomonas sp. LaA6.9]MCJ8155911.1 DUF2497 domain-containing protein [Sphingomonas sp. LaA6.9]